MKTSLRRRLAAGKRRIEKRLDKAHCQGCDRPLLRPTSIRYELAERTQGMTYSGIGSMLLLVRKLGLAEAIDRRLHLLKIHLPYHESDHVLNLAFNTLCNATCLEDLELRRNDEVYLDAVNARRIPDPTTAGEGTGRRLVRRRFQPTAIASKSCCSIFQRLEKGKGLAKIPAESTNSRRVFRCLDA